MKAFLNSLWSRRFIRVILWCLITTIVLFIFGTALVNWTGQRRWLQAEADLKKAGETLDFKAILPPPIPEEHNFAAIQPLRGINFVEDGDQTKGVSGAKRKALETFASSIPRDVRLSKEGVAFAQKADFQELVQAWPGLPTGSSQPPAEVIRATLEKAAGPLFKTLVEGAHQRQAAEFVPAWRDQVLPPNLFALQIPHYSSATGIVSVLAMHGLACVELGDTAAATADALTIPRLAQACGREPLLVGHLVTSSLHHEALEIIWALLERRQATDAELQVLMQTLQQIDFEEMLLFALRGELATGLNAIGDIEKNPALRSGFLVGRVVDNQPSITAKLLGWGIPQGLFTHSRATMLKIEMEYLLEPLKKGGLNALVQNSDFLREAVTEHSLILRPDYLMSRLMIPTVGAVVRHTGFEETCRRQALIACALERHYLQHQSYPAQLVELMPSMPNDIFDGQPMRYRRTESGRYSLWSIALDCKDDEGQVKHSPPIKSSKYQGDWAWQYEPVK